MSDGATISVPRTVGIEFAEVEGRPTLRIEVDGGSIWLEPGYQPDMRHFVLSIRGDDGQHIGTLTLDAAVSDLPAPRT